MDSNDKTNVLLIISLLAGCQAAASQVCGNSPEFANFRRPKPLNFPAGEDVEPESARIINGEMAKQGAWPWQVSIKLTNPRIGSIGHWCGAVLLDQDWILTAAHCVQNKLINALGGGIWTVVLGEYDRDHVNGEEVEMVVDTIRVHPNFTDYQNDIGNLDTPTLLFLTDLTQFLLTSHPISFPSL